MKNGTHGYYPEMEHKQPECQIEATFCLGKFYVKTPLELKGRGITFGGKFETILPKAMHKNGWNVYHVTVKAMQKIKEQYAVGLQILLD